MSAKQTREFENVEVVEADEAYCPVCLHTAEKWSDVQALRLFGTCMKCTGEQLEADGAYDHED